MNEAHVVLQQSELLNGFEERIRLTGTSQLFAAAVCSFMVMTGESGMRSGSRDIGIYIYLPVHMYIMYLVVEGRVMYDDDDDDDDNRRRPGGRQHL